jgi:acyl carrier protein
LGVDKAGARKISAAATILMIRAMAPHPTPDTQSLPILHSEVQRLLGFILRRDIGEAENPSRATEPAWDSLRHVELVFLLEDHFGIRLNEREIAELEDALGIERAVEDHLLHALLVCGESEETEPGERSPGRKNADRKDGDKKGPKKQNAEAKNAETRGTACGTI